MTAILDDTDDDEAGFVWLDDVTDGHYFRARDEARSRVDLLRLVAHYSGRAPTAVEGGSTYKAPCFFPSKVAGFAGSCAEQDASVGSPADNLSITRAADGTHWRWRCFSCGRGQTRDGAKPGDVVDLVTQAEGYEINEGRSGSLRGLRRTLQLVGLSHVLDGRSAPASAVSAPLAELLGAAKVPALRESPKVALADALKLNARACGHWQRALQSEGSRALEYLHSRGVTDEQISRYAIGYAPPSFDSLTKALGGHPAASVLGLTKPTSTGKTRDAQIDRVVLPYCYGERPGRPLGVYGFAGRNLAGVDPATGEDIEGYEHRYGHPPKWLNSTNVPGVWHKGEDLLGAWQACARLEGAAPRQVGYVEGGFDMLALDRIESPSLAMVGKESTIRHALLYRDSVRASAVTYALDGDASGWCSAPKFAASFVAVGYDVDVLSILESDEGRDPATTPPDVLAHRWAYPLPVLAFLRAAIGDGRLTLSDLRPLFAVAPSLASLFGVDAPPQPLVSVADALVVRQLREHPDLAPCLAADDARALLSNCPEWPTVEGLAFGEANTPDDLPPLVRRAWLRLLVDDRRARSAACGLDGIPLTDREALSAKLAADRAARRELRELESALTKANGST